MPATLIFPEGTNVSIGSGWDATARVLKADFSPNPVSRARDGMNNVNRSYSVTIDMFSDSEMKALDDFLTARAGAESFYWTMPGEASPRRWTCEKWGIRHIESVVDIKPEDGYDLPVTLHSMTATFEEIVA